jgi:gamma-glutamylcyclotransferase (GGCT)/AIG2-like uncharacterized protein YtfP
LEEAQLYLYAAGTYAHLRVNRPDYQPVGAYPYAVEGPGRIAGHLIELKPELYATLLVELDWLEGYSEEAGPDENEYLRIAREIQHENGARTLAWVYLAAPAAFARQAPNLSPIESGDWLAWRKLNKTPDETD